MSSLSTLFSLLKAFFGPSAGSISGYLNLVELLKTIVAAVVAGGGVYGALTQILASVAVIVAPGYVGLATAALTFAIEVYRRLNHGVPATPAAALKALSS